jgi:predicted ATPase
MGFTIAGMGLAEPLEREAELTQLSALLTAAQNGRGQVGVVEGPSGVGKSRLLDECATLARGLELSILRARCSELTHDHPSSSSVHFSSPRWSAPTRRHAPN